jgi:hypothetical protein
MSESEDIAPLFDRLAPENRNAMDEEDRLRPDFVREVLDAAADGDDERARALVEPLHPADVADLIELAAADEREGLLVEFRRRLRTKAPVFAVSAASGEGCRELMSEVARFLLMTRSDLKKEIDADKRLRSEHAEDVQGSA